MANFFEMLIGPRTAADGALVQARGDREAALLVQLNNGQYVEAVRRGRVFVASTAAAGVAPGTALSTTPPFTLYNPANSGKLLVPVRALLGFISGTLGAGTVVYGVNNTQGQAAPSGGTVLTPQNMLVGGPQDHAGRAFQGATLPAAPTLLRPAFVLGAFTTSTAVPPALVADELNGSLAVKPGAMVSLQGIAAAGTAPLVLLGMEWVEIPE